jgi:hypothetical protein
MDAGMDSLMAVEFRTRIAETFPAAALPATMGFDFPTLTAISMEIASRLSANQDDCLGLQPPTSFANLGLIAYRQMPSSIFMSS